MMAKKKPHPLTGNKHAQIGDEPLAHTYQLRCTRADYLKWDRHAAKEDLTLAAWVRAQLNRACD